MVADATVHVCLIGRNGLLANICNHDNKKLINFLSYNDSPAFDISSLQKLLKFVKKCFNSFFLLIIG